MGYWKTKVLPKIKKAFETGPSKKAAAADACKDFDQSKEEMIKELEDNKPELQPKVMEIYEACTPEIKAVLKAPSASSVKKHSDLVNKLLEDLAKIEFPGSKKVSEASAKYGPFLVSSSVVFVFEKVTTFLPAEPAPAAVTKELPTKELPKEEEKKEEKKEDKKEDKKEEIAPEATPSAAAAAAVEEKKVEVEPAEEKKEVEKTPPPPEVKKEACAAEAPPAPAKASAEPEAAAKPVEEGKA